MKDRITQTGVWHACVVVGLAGLGFFTPFSSAGVAFALALIVVLAFWPARRLWREAPWNEPVMAVGLGLFAYIVIQTLVTGGNSASSRQAISQYQELLLAPILYSVLRDARRRQVLMLSLFAGAVALALMVWAAPLHPELQAMIFKRRISAGFALAVCAFLVVMRAKDTPHPWPARVVAAFLAFTVLFGLDGRTGQLLVIVLAVLTVWLHSTRRVRWVASLAGLLVVLALAWTSGTVGSRMKETLSMSPGGDETVVTSTGIRVELMRVALALAQRYGVAGAGYGNYTQVHAQMADEIYRTPVEGANVNWMRSTNPHNEYFMQLIGGGIVGAALFIAWLAAAFRAALRAPPAIGVQLGAVVVAFAIGCLFNSLLLDFIEGHFYMALVACLLAQARATRHGDTDEVRSVLIIATRQIGDVLLTTPLIRAARRRWPDARIDVIGFAGTLGMLRNNADINGYFETPAKSGWRDARSLASRLWRRYDLALVTDPGDRAHLLGWIAAPQRAGIVPAAGRSNWLKRALLRHTVVAAGDQGTVHVTAEKQSLIAPWLDESSVRADVIAPPPRDLPGDIAAALQPGAVVVHAPSMWPYKQWPVAHFEELVKALLAMGRQVVLTGSAGARDKECIAPLLTLAPAPQLLDVSGQLDFNQLVAVLQRAALYIGPDTSVSHLAAATGVPVIAIFGPTNPMRWAPWPAKSNASEIFERSTLVQRIGNVTLLQSDLPCVPCGKAGCEDHRQSRSDCLVAIGPDRVLEQVRLVLAR
ncbi:glycosyltransferase family 9 protein [Caenimonas koreensis]|uniref:glycosyltransferase family 9 protein n=1 Tax=Caenimonas koreensis TaxID=367474 RepID=UPI003783F841